MLLRRSMLYALAGLIAVFGLAMLNVAAYFFLRDLGPGLGGACRRARRPRPGADRCGHRAGNAAGPGAAGALELRDVAIEGLEAELGPLQERFAWLSRAARDPFDTVLPAILVPLITAIVRGLRKDKPS